MSKRRGFTLIELLIAITIIVILGSMAIASYQASRKNGRNAKRRGDIVALQQAFEQYYIVSNQYPNPCSDVVDDGYVQGGYPEDPQPYDAASYKSTCTNDAYCICAFLEDAEGNATDEDCTFGSGGNWFCVQNQQ